ncbi:MAG: peptidase M4 [Bryobacteraceae bacterium]
MGSSAGPRANVTQAAKAIAQSQSAGKAGYQRAPETGGEGRKFTIGPGVTRAVAGKPYERKGRDPLFRPLKIFTLDPNASRLDGAVSVLTVPYERLRPGPIGSILAVVDRDGSRSNTPVDLDAPEVLIRQGLEPSPSNPQFRQQMVYAICSSIYAVFRTALGRPVAWGFDKRSGAISTRRLVIRPHGMDEQNSYYRRETGELLFGYFKAPDTVEGRNIPHGTVFTCLSHDIVAHEVTHALLDGLRSSLTIPSNPDVLAFHEAFADLVAFLQRFSYREVVLAALSKSGGDLAKATSLVDLARQFSQTTGLGECLRRAFDKDLTGQEVRRRRNSDEPHERGSVLVAAVFDAFDTVFKRKIKRYLRLATNGTGILPAGELNSDLLGLLAKEASELASQFLSICIRAIDYCPPVDIEFGEYLRAIITADQALVPDDPWNYREALIDAFRVRGIYPPFVDNLSEDSLVWREPMRRIPRWSSLTFSRLRFRGDPANAAGIKELKRQASELGGLITKPGCYDLFGLVDRDAAEWVWQDVDLPCVQSIRSTRRIGPDGQIVFDLIAEVTQRRTAHTEDGTPYDFYGGSTIILGPDGEIRYTINKRICQRDREKTQREFIQDTPAKLWSKRDGRLVPSRLALADLHQTRFSADTRQQR